MGKKADNLKEVRAGRQKGESSLAQAHKEKKRELYEEKWVELYIKRKKRKNGIYM